MFALSVMGLAGLGCQPDPCKTCSANGTPYVCVCDGVKNVVCGVDDATALVACEDLKPDATSSCTLGKKISCDGPPPTGTDTDGGQSQWNPGASVYFDGVTYQVDAAFVDALKADPNQLLWDSARLAAVSGGYAFRNVAPADLAAQLGFQDGDQPLRVEVGRARYPLTNFDEFVTALDAVYDETALSVVFRRGRQTLRHDYLVVSP